MKLYSKCVRTGPGVTTDSISWLIVSCCLVSYSNICMCVQMQCNQSSVPSAAHLEGLAAASPWSSLDEQLRASIRATVGFRGDDALPEDVFHLLPFAEPALSDVHPELSPWRVRVDEPQTKTPPAVGKYVM